MRRKEGEKEEIPSSGFSLKPLVKVNEGCMQSSETDYITAPLINSVSVHLPMVRNRGSVRKRASVHLCLNICETGCTQSQPGAHVLHSVLTAVYMPVRMSLCTLLH